jgi:hypothetical protein
MPGGGWDKVGPPTYDDLLVPFRSRLREIAETRDVIDQIDLVRADPETCQRFRALRRLEVIYAMMLIELIEENADALRGQLETALRDS